MKTSMAQKGRHAYWVAGMDSREATCIQNLSGEVGVVVIGRNEGQRLVNCLNSIDTDTFTTVYVDSGSTDESIAAAEKLGATVVKLDMALPFTAARARNKGSEVLKTLKGTIKYLQFIDGDCTLNIAWLSSAMAFMVQHENIGVACGRLRELHPETSIYNWLCDVEWDTPLGEVSSCGGIALMRLNAFEAVGGFNEHLIAGEEPELCARLRYSGWKIWRLSSEMACHDAAIAKFNQWWRRSVRTGFAYASVFQLHAGSPLVLWRREVLRAIFWATILPVVILVITVLTNVIGVILILAYPLQIARIAIRRGAFESKSWYYAIFMVLSKFAEFQGILRYLWGRSYKGFSHLIEYK